MNAFGTITISPSESAALVSRHSATWARVFRHHTDFIHVGNRLSPDVEQRTLGWFLDRAYSDVRRTYHNWDHIWYMIRLLDATPDLQQRDRDLIELAIFWHDVVYDAHRTDNEEISAQLVTAFATLQQQQASASSAMVAVATMIRATVHGWDESLPNEVKFMCDLDLMGLALPDTNYDRNSLALRSEYDHLDNETWLQGRCTWIERMRDRPRIFYNPYQDPAYRGFEIQARHNMHREYGRSAVILDGVRNGLVR